MATENSCGAGSNCGARAALGCSSTGALRSSGGGSHSRSLCRRPKIQQQAAVRVACAVVGLVLITAGFCGWTALLVQSHSVQPAALAQAQPHEHR